MAAVPFPGAAPGRRVLEAERPRMALHPGIDGAPGKETRSEGELFSPGQAEQ